MAVDVLDATEDRASGSGDVRIDGKSHADAALTALKFEQIITSAFQQPQLLADLETRLKLQDGPAAHAAPQPAGARAPRSFGWNPELALPSPSKSAAGAAAGVAAYAAGAAVAAATA